MPTNRYMDLEIMLDAVREHLARWPQDADRLLWADDLFTEEDALTVGETSWRISRSDVKACPNEPLRNALITHRGKEALLKALKRVQHRSSRGRRYGNNRAWDFIRDPDDELPIPHVHACPKCYEYVPCEMGCYLEPDLELDDGTPCGSHCVCDQCSADGETTEAAGGRHAKQREH